MDYSEKKHLCNMVKVACSKQDIKLLKSLLPTPDKLVEYRDMQNGGSLLHTLMYANGDKLHNNPMWSSCILIRY